ncbi:MAG: hypothetical protein K5790_08600 [Nitrosopumilus sp.]|uniref:hypothetical protein n=1 Tax=Nitrosopumilus sp. TaxID=2024843 RepID=UPI00247E8AED|nr:hypothetical protein [Nitrosopumilus sp.]MCV0393328.1 hypothetical protein [Nitrosopumilus sp.]
MFIKLGIIAGIIILAGMIFSNEIDVLFPSTSASVFDSLKEDVSNIGTKTTDSVEKRLDDSIDNIIDKTSKSVTNEISEVGEKISDQISDAKDSSQKTINEEISNFDPLKAVKNIFTDNSKAKFQTESTEISSSTNPVSQNTDPIIYETLSLSTIQESDNDILLRYYDSSGKTTSVNVKIRTDHKEIFSGTFYTSMFETIVNDASGIPYYVDMIVDHQEYGIVNSSVFNPGDNSDSKINGMFSQS